MTSVSATICTLVHAEPIDRHRPAEFTIFLVQAGTGLFKVKAEPWGSKGIERPEPLLQLTD